MKNLKKLILLAMVFLMTPLFIDFSVNAASLGFDKATGSVTVGSTIQLAVTIAPGSDAVSSADIYVSYDSTLLKVNSVTAGSLFPTVSNDISTSGKVYIAAMVNDPANSILSSGTVATITFQGLKDGTANLSFDCATSKVIKNDINATNVITCSQNGTSVLTVGVGGTTNPTATPATGSTPSTLPQSGILDNLIKFAVPGAILLFLGSLLRFI